MSSCWVTAYREVASGASAVPLQQFQLPASSPPTIAFGISVLAAQCANAHHAYQGHTFPTELPHPGLHLHVTETTRARQIKSPAGKDKGICNLGYYVRRQTKSIIYNKTEPTVQNHKNEPSRQQIKESIQKFQIMALEQCNLIIK